MWPTQAQDALCRGIPRFQNVETWGTLASGFKLEFGHAQPQMWPTRRPEPEMHFVMESHVSKTSKRGAPWRQGSNWNSVMPSRRCGPPKPKMHFVVESHVSKTAKRGAPGTRLIV
jgi:hypothetical protein